MGILSARCWLPLTLAATLSLLPVVSSATECVIVLHGLARSARSMEPMADTLANAGYAIANIDYPSTTAPIEILAPEAIGLNHLIENRRRLVTRNRHI